MKQKILILASIAAGLAAAALAHAWFVAKNGEVEEMKRKILAATRKVTVLGAARTIPQGATIRADDLVPIVLFESGTTGDNIPVEERLSVVGRVASHTIGESDPVLWTYLDGGRGAGRGLADDVPDGMRAASIPVSGASAVSGLVRPGDHVDVLGSFALPGSDGKASGELQFVTMTVLQNVTVLATGTTTARSRTRRDGGDGATTGYGTVTLCATPREAEVLVFAQQMKGRLFLTLRNGSDVYYEKDLPRVDFSKIESELGDLNGLRQAKLHGIPSRK
jgi:pilus assembly protein CpaB